MVKRKQKKRVAKTFATEPIVMNTWLRLLSDFQNVHGETFAVKAAEAFKTGVGTYREYEYPELGLIPPHRFKCWTQLASFFKKYTFERDALTESERESFSIENYFDTQKRIAQPMQVTTTAHMVMQRARHICARILGPYDEGELLEHVRFGKKSSIGCPLNLAYIDNKLSDVGAFTSSSCSYRWFRRTILSSDRILRALVRRFKLESLPEQRQLDYLKLVCVPKKWNIDRVITPMPLIDLFYSYGISGVVTDRLKVAGLDISSLQHDHRRLVKEISTKRLGPHKRDDTRGGYLMTADLSAASDSITMELLMRVLPREWLKALKPIILRYIEVDGVKHATYSVLPMGNGATFPLETLIFYSLVRAIRELSGKTGLVSVYGDDLIYPSSIHKYVSSIFPKIHLMLNLDKTFSRYPFRESCGADYYRGFDVRPFFLRGGAGNLTRTRYQAYLYKLINGLLRRWDQAEIPLTIAYLYQQVSSVDLICIVPPSYPDTSGVKVHDLVNHGVPWYAHRPVKAIFSNGSRWYEFHFLLDVPKDRFVVVQEPYYWLSLQSRDDDITDKNFWDIDYSFMYGAVKRQPLRWTSVKRSKHFIDAKGLKRKRVVKKKKAVVDSRMGSTTRPTTNCVSDWC